MVFGPFWSEDGYTLCTFLSGIGIVFEGTTGMHGRSFRFNSK